MITEVVTSSLMMQYHIVHLFFFAPFPPRLVSSSMLSFFSWTYAADIVRDSHVRFFSGHITSQASLGAF
jgi:hypothetical protein